MGAIKGHYSEKPLTYRKVAIGTWVDAKDPTVYGWDEFDVTETLTWIDKVSKDKGVKLNLNDIVNQLVVVALKEVPELNSFLRGSRLFHREHIDIFHQVLLRTDRKTKDKWDLSGCTLYKCEEFNIIENSKRLKQEVKDTRLGRTEIQKTQQGLIKFIPAMLVKYLLDFSSFLTYRLNLNLRYLGLPKDPFGSVIISNVGQMGISVSLLPIPFYTRVAMLIGIGSVAKKPLVIDGEIKARDVLTLSLTFDHRIGDGIHFSKLVKSFRRSLSNPEKYLM